ncbi:hypothetical protein [Thermococcus sp. JdF3]|uniref:hypothetical protein n=1 Tax=Thermococcus sp. JdF3 TaxID=1638258 RepID=UPI00143B361A|nr:hypothetical protein [Thermococcus sp. JdF3]NJE01831.1 hypothetical protein [Thermococcus sp. JdF3]
MLLIKGIGGSTPGLERLVSPEVSYSLGGGVGQTTTQSGNILGGVGQTKILMGITTDVTIG